MGRIKDWNTLFMRAFQGEEFEAVMTEIPYEETNEALFDEIFQKRYERVGKLTTEGKYKKTVAGEGEAYEEDEYFSKEAERLMRCAEEGFEEMIDFFEGAQKRYGFEAEEYNLTEKALSAFEAFEKKEERVYALQGDITDEDGGFGEKSGMRLSRERAVKILDGAVKAEDGARKHEIRIEMVSDNAQGEAVDVDEMLEEMTQRLCAMMTKGADGIYL